MEALLEAPTELTVTPVLLEPGIYYGLSAEEYHALPYASNSRLGKLLRSPAHLKEELDNPREKTPALILGGAIHTAVLEPHLFDEQYAVAPECDKRTTVGKATWAAFVEANKGKTVLKNVEARTCTAISKTAHQHPSAGTLLEASGPVEPTLIWDCPITGVRCKARPDKLCTDLGVIADLKSTENASEGAFVRSIFTYGYYRQAAFYIDGLKANGIDISDFVFIAAEKSAPYGIGAYRIMDEAVELGRKQLAGLLKTYAECQRSGVWPCYSDEIRDIGLPAYAWSQIEVSDDTDNL